MMSISQTMTEERVLRILLVEDSIMAVEVVTAQLQEGLANHEAIRATTAAEALAGLDDGGIDIVLLDLNLPDSEGLATFRRIRSHAPWIPVVILSGDDNEALAVEAVREGAQDYLVKSRFDHEHLSRSIRFAVERVQRLQIEQEVAAARAIQEQLYPSSEPDVPGFDIAGMAFPALEVSGDYFDFIPMSGGRLGIAIGDVSGHGLGPALRMAETRAYLRALAYDGGSAGVISDTGDPAGLLHRTNELLLTAPSWQFVTLFFLVLNPADHTYTFASAGHRIFHLSHDGKVHILGSTGPALGLSKDAEFTTVGPTHIEPGDLLFMGTDGFEEAYASDHKLFGVNRLLDAVRSDPTADSATVIRIVSAAAMAFSGGTPQSDDMTAVVIQSRK